MSTRDRFRGVSLLMILLSAGGCRSRQPETQPPQYTTDATIKDLMDSMVDPSADVVWNSVATVVSTTGTEDRLPSTDEEWKTVREAAIRIVEASNLLVMPGRHVARPHERSDNPGIELEPEEMDVLIAKDVASWRARAKALHDAGLEALNAVDARNGHALNDIGEHIDGACENCHVHYWYPNQKLPPGYGQAPITRRPPQPDKR